MPKDHLNSNLERIRSETKFDTIASGVVFSTTLRHVDALLLRMIINLNKISLTSSFMVCLNSLFRRSLIFHGRLIEFYDLLATHHHASMSGHVLCNSLIEEREIKR